jgi:hypothetical protein
MNTDFRSPEARTAQLTDEQRLYVFSTHYAAWLGMTLAVFLGSLSTAFYIIFRAWPPPGS